MKCPNCNTVLDNEALVCFACGQEIPEELRRQGRGDQDREFDEAIQSLLPDEEAEAEKEFQQKLKRKKKEAQKREGLRRQYRYVSLAALGVLGLFFLSLFLKWYSISGTAAFRGYFYTAKTGRYLTESVRLYSRDELTDRTDKVAAFTPNQLLTYVQEYEAGTEIQGLLSHLQIYYAKGLILLYFLIAACAAVLLLDKNGRWSELIRTSSILAVIFILLNTLAIKLPYINLLVLNAKRVLSAGGISSRIAAKGLLLLGGSHSLAEGAEQTTLTYQAGLEAGWMLAVVLAALWFVLGTVLNEMSRAMNDAADTEA